MLLLQLRLLLLVDSAHLLDLLHGSTVDILDLLLDQSFFGHAWLLGLSLLLGDLLHQSLVLKLDFLLLLSFARFITVVMGAWVLLFVPAIATTAWF
jgi:hypothetical protein